MTTTGTGQTGTATTEAALEEVALRYAIHESAIETTARAERDLAVAIRAAEETGLSLRRIAPHVGSNHVRLMRIRDRHHQEQT